jgi:hypothetical protein
LHGPFSIEQKIQAAVLPSSQPVTLGVIVPLGGVAGAAMSMSPLGAAGICGEHCEYADDESNVKDRNKVSKNNALMLNRRKPRVGKKKHLYTNHTPPFGYV